MNGRGGRSGSALEAGGNLDTIASDTTSIDSKTPALGTAAAAAAVPVTLATEDAAKVPALGAAAAAAAVPVTLATEDAAKVPALGAALAAASTPVVLASDSPQGRINAKGNTPVQIAIADGNSTQSAALPVGTYIVTSNIDVAILAGSNPTATTAKDPLWAYSYRRVVIETADDKIAAIRLVASTGTVTITLEG